MAAANRAATTIALLMVAAASAAPAAPRVAVRTEADGVDRRCPTSAEVSAALKRRIPNLQIDDRGALDGSDLLVSLAPSETGWTCGIEQNGRLALTRALGAPPGGCTALVDFCVLAVDRFLSDLTWRGDVPEIPAGALAQAPRSPPVRTAWRLGVGGMWRAPTSGEDGAAGLVVSGGAMGRHGLALALSFMGRLPEHRVLQIPDVLPGNDPGVDVRIWHLGATAAVGLCSGGRFKACVSAVAGALAARASATGSDLHAAQARLTLHAAVGGRLDLAMLVARSLELRAVATGLGRLGQSRFTFEGVSSPVYVTPRFEPLFTIELAKIF